MQYLLILYAPHARNGSKDISSRTGRLRGGRSFRDAYTRFASPLPLVDTKSRADQREDHAKRYTVRSTRPARSETVRQDSLYNPARVSEAI